MQLKYHDDIKWQDLSKIERPTMAQSTVRFELSRPLSGLRGPMYNDPLNGIYRSSCRDIDPYALDRLLTNMAEGRVLFVRTFEGDTPYPAFIWKADEQHPDKGHFVLGDHILANAEFRLEILLNTVKRPQQRGSIKSTSRSPGKEYGYIASSTPPIVSSDEEQVLSNLGVTSDEYHKIMTEDNKYSKGVKLDANADKMPKGEVKGLTTKQKVFTETFPGQFAAGVIGAPIASISEALGGDGVNPLTDQYDDRSLVDKAFDFMFVPSAKMASSASKSFKAIDGVSDSKTIASASSGNLKELLPVSSLNKRQQVIHSSLADQGATGQFHKKDVSMSDLRAIGQVTGDEYNMFTLGSRRTILRGNGNEVSVIPQMYDDLISGSYGKWSGHTHPPGYSLTPGPADRPFLDQMGQKRSTIWGDDGHYTYGQLPSDDTMIQSEIMRKQWGKIYGD